MKARRIFSAVLILAFVACLFIGCDNKTKQEEPESIVSFEKINNLPTDSVYLEWLGGVGYNKYKPTVIYIHGETKYNDKTEIALDRESYYTEEAYKNSTALSGYNIVAPGTSNLTDEPTFDLSSYWLKKKYNVGILHWEAFADDSLDVLLKKLYTLPNMRYKTDDGLVTATLPDHNLTEIVSAVLMKSIPDDVYGEEIRFVANGVGCDLALSVCDYLYNALERGAVENGKLPVRLALCDPYLPASELGCEVGWRDIDETSGMLGVANQMLSYLTVKGLVVELIEASKEVKGEKNVTVVEGEEIYDATIETVDYVMEYAPSYTEEQQKLKDSLVEKTAYLKFRQSYSAMFSADYAAQKRVAADWYFYSVIGSDFTVITSKYGSEYAIINNYGRNKSFSAYAIGAWTPTAYIRALKGVRFASKTYVSTSSTTDVHGISAYTKYADYTAAYFRAELYQCAQNMDKTVVCGYIYNDKNGDAIMNDGVGMGLKGIKLTAILNYNSKREELATAYSGEDGFYVFEYARSFKALSPDASVDYTITIMAETPSKDYVTTDNPYATSYALYVRMSANNFKGDTLSTDNEITPSYGGLITIKNCLIRVEK